MPMQPDRPTVECSCGAVFEPEEETVDRHGERWTICPKCKARLPLAALIAD